MNVDNPPLFTDDDDTLYVILATSGNAEGLRRLERTMFDRLFDGKIVEHFDEVWIHTGHTNLLLVRKTTWDALYRGDRIAHAVYASGWVDALD